MRWKGGRMGFLLVMLTFPLALRAQEPAIGDTARNALRLPVYDDFGQIIPEDLIRSKMKPRSKGWMVTNTILVWTAFLVATRPGADCSIYDPCTPREKFRSRHGAWIGLPVGAMLATAINAGVDRERAVSIIRQERRRARASAAP